MTQFMRRKTIGICYKMFTICSLAIGIGLNLHRTTSRRALLSYYTLQSNIICLLAFVVIIWLEVLKKKYKTELYYLIKGALIISIAITAIMYHIALSPKGFEMDSLIKSINNKVLANLLVHTISPILVILDYVMLDEKGHFKYYYPFIWIIQPLNYIVYVYTYSKLGGTFYNIGGSKKFAYFFLDYNELGYLGVIKWIIIIGSMILLVSEILVIIDKKCKWNSRDRFQSTKLVSYHL